MDRLSSSNADALEPSVRQSASVIRSDWSRSEPPAERQAEPQAERQIDHDSTAARLKQSLAILSEAAQSFAWELDFVNLFQLIARHGSQLLGAEQVIAYSLEDGNIQREGWHPPSRPGWPQVEPLPRELLQILARPEPILQKPSSRGAQPASNAMFVPLVGTQNRLLAIIQFERKRWGGIFSETDLQLAIALGRVATTAVDRARLFDRIQDWSKSIEMLLSFNAAVNQHLHPTELLRQLLVNAVGFVDADGGAAGLAIEHDFYPAMECESYYFDGVWYPFERRWINRQGVVGTVMETEFPLLLPRYRESELADGELVQRFDLGPCICVGIKNSEQKLLGFFKLHRRTGKAEFTWQEAALLESLGNTAAVAIENARLVKSLELTNDQVKKLSAANVRRLEEERQHIARELHDETGQVLIGLKLRLQLLARRLQPEQVDAIHDLNQLREQVNEAAVRLNRLAKRLRPPTLDELGFEATLRQLVAEYRQKAGLKIGLDVSNRLRFSEDAETALYRIVQEGLTNIVKHSAAQQVLIRLFDHEGKIAMDLEDDGCGFDLEAATSGLGLMGIHERVKMLGAAIQVQSQIGKGTRLEIRNVAPQPEAQA